jgi:hypothetical protein
MHCEMALDTYHDIGTIINATTPIDMGTNIMRCTKIPCLSISRCVVGKLIKNILLKQHHDFLVGKISQYQAC